ncbi:MAG: PadR family transcriptional regulator [Thermoplasmata archaeon]|nr:PadR family transcriptional regulator [Thermoplasmata archaeon]
MDLTSELVGFVAGAGLTAAGVGVWLLIRRLRTAPTPEAVGPASTAFDPSRGDHEGVRPPAAASAVPSPHGEPSFDAGFSSPPGRGPTTAGPASPAPPAGTDLRNGRAAPPGEPAPEPVRLKREVLRLSQRVVLHIAGQGFLPPNEVAPPGLSQMGMVADLGAAQTSLTKVLQRLEAAGVLTVGRAHVRGQPRRLKVYRLTPLGESLARELRSQAAAARRRNGAESADSIYR